MLGKTNQISSNIANEIKRTWNHGFYSGITLLKSDHENEGVAVWNEFELSKKVV